MSAPRIYLAGLSASGKTTVAALLGRWLGVPAADVDTEIEREAGRPVVELWAAGGEAAFRAAEARAIERLVARPGPGVIALGGGTLEDPGSRDRLAGWGRGVWLDAPAGTLAARLGAGANARPLLAKGDPAAALAALAAARRPRFAALPIRVSAVVPSPEAVAVAALRSVGAPEPVALGGGVRLGRGALAGAGRLLADALPDAPRGRLVVVTDATVRSLHGAALDGTLAAAGWDPEPVELPAGEAGKDAGSLARVWQALAAAGADRDAPLAVLGGGALGDVGGLAAATWKRGIPLALFPTTLLAQVDAAIGGKNAIDLGGVKNVVGTFHDPTLVVVDPLSPLTQSDRDWRSGWAEIMKSGLIADPELFELCEREVEAIGDRRLDVVEAAIGRAARVKLGVVATDPREAGPRQALNLGHTLGHSVESAAAGALTHGEAVAIGLVAAARLSESEGVAAAGLADRVAGALSALGLPVRPPAGLDSGRLLAHVRQDKKRRGGAVHAVLLARPGETVIRALAADRLAPWVAETVEDGVPAGRAR